MAQEHRLISLVSDRPGHDRSPNAADNATESRWRSQPAMVSNRKNLPSGDPKIGLTAINPGLRSSLDESRGSRHWGATARL